MTGGVAAPACPPTSARSSGEEIDTAFAQSLALCMSLSRFTVYGMLCLHCKEAPRMASVRCIDVQSRPTAVLDVTSLTLDEFQLLVPPFEAAFQAHMASRCLDGKPLTACQFTVYHNCPLPTPEDCLFFMLVSLKTSALQVVQGCLFGMGQSKAHQWIHVL